MYAIPTDWSVDDTIIISSSSSQTHTYIILYYYIGFAPPFNSMMYERLVRFWSSGGRARPRLYIVYVRRDVLLCVLFGPAGPRVSRSLGVRPNNCRLPRVSPVPTAHVARKVRPSAVRFARMKTHVPPAPETRRCYYTLVYLRIYFNIVRA